MFSLTRLTPGNSWIDARDSFQLVRFHHHIVKCNAHLFSTTELAKRWHFCIPRKFAIDFFQNIGLTSVKSESAR